MNEYIGQKIVISYDSNTCVHAGECVKNLPGVFDVNRNPWVNADGAKVEEIKKVVGMCPSGALSYKDR